VIDDPAERERRALQYRSPPESILAVLNHLDVRYGGVTAYLRAAGVMDEQLGRIRVRLLEGGHTG
jgi:protein-tyrosine phosphatase